MLYAQHLHNGDSVQGDYFGGSLAVGDFFRKASYQGLVVGIPGETLDAQLPEGAIWIYAGGSSTMASKFYRSQKNLYSVSDTDTILPTEQRDIGFGTALVSGNFNGGGGDELVVGAPTDDPGQDGSTAGAVFVFRYNSFGDAEKIDQVTTRYGDSSFD